MRAPSIGLDERGGSDRPDYLSSVYDAMKTAVLALVVFSISSMPLLPFADGPKPIGDKTLVVWAAPADLAQRGGSALTIEKGGGVFDAVVLGELSAGKWMAGNNGFSITQAKRGGWPSETACSTSSRTIAGIIGDTYPAPIYSTGDKYMLLCISHQLGARYYLGDWKNEQFHPTHHEIRQKGG
jgi:hypothetical protein